MITPKQLEEWRALCLSVPAPQMYTTSGWESLKESSQERFVRQSLFALPALIFEVERLRVLLEQSISVAEQFGDFSNGITDEYGTVDEGRVMARKFYERLRAEVTESDKTEE